MNETEQMLTSILKCRRVDLYSDHPELTIQQQQELSRMRKRRQSGEPLQYILGHSDFMGFEFFVNRSVFIPRPETEILIEKTLEIIQSYGENRPLRILDLGTGSGNIAIVLAKNLERAHVTAVELSQDALAVARYNAKQNSVDNRIFFVHEDMKRFLESQSERAHLFDVVISNPPYIPTDELEDLPEDVKQEPPLALDGGEDGFDFFDLIIEHVPALLKNYGYLFLEFGDEQRDELEKVFKSSTSFYSPVFQQDYTETDRIVFAQKRHQ